MVYWQLGAHTCTHTHSCLDPPLQEISENIPVCFTELQWEECDTLCHYVHGRWFRRGWWEKRKAFGRTSQGPPTLELWISSDCVFRRNVGVRAGWWDRVRVKNISAGVFLLLFGKWCKTICKFLVMGVKRDRGLIFFLIKADNGFTRSLSLVAIISWQVSRFFLFSWLHCSYSAL